ncbi:MAG: hypothetical protein ACOC2W_02335 [bacterium]
MTILKFNDYIKESSSYGMYLKDAKFMKFFNKFKNRVLDIYPIHSDSVIDLMIDTVYELYHDGFDVDSVVGQLYKTANVPTRD